MGVIRFRTLWYRYLYNITAGVCLDPLLQFGCIYKQNFEMARAPSYLSCKSYGKFKTGFEIKTLFNDRPLKKTCHLLYEDVMTTNIYCKLMVKKNIK